MTEVHQGPGSQVTPAEVRDRLGSDPFGLHRHFFLRTKTVEYAEDGAKTTEMHYECSCGTKVSP